MKKYIISAAVVGFMVSMNPAKAGNEDRAGSAGAQELLINPWSSSSGSGDAGISSVRGLESMFINVAGLAFSPNTQIGFTRTSWLGGSGININALGLAQRAGEKNVLGLSIMQMDFGDIPITTTDLPEGGIGTFSPNYFILGLSYAREFSQSIYGGITVKLLNESIANVNASGVAFDVGIRYVTGERDQIKFGIALKNVGPPMRFDGDGLAFSIENPVYGGNYNTQQRSALIELPSTLSIGGSYDFMFGEDHTLTPMLAYTSNSFTKDQYRIGLDYAWDLGRAKFMVRGGFVYENGVFNSAERTTAFTGPSAGAAVEVPFGTSGAGILFDYAYRATNPFSGVHSIGIKVNIGGKDE